jgi:hypothetical protein
MEFKLPITKIITQSFAITWFYKNTLLTVLAAPIFVSIFYNILCRQYYTFSSFTNIFVYNIIYLLLLTFILVNCHRIFLLGDSFASKYGFGINKFFIKFFLWEIILFTILFFIWYLFIFVIINTSLSIPFIEIDTEDQFFKNYIKWIESFSKIIAFYIVARVCLVLPSVAIGGMPSIKWSWRTTKNNGWRMFLLVGFLPWLLTEVVDLFYRENASTLEHVILSIFSYLIITVEVAFLSLSFKFFREHYN